MTMWKSVLHADPISRLLERENPSVRYYALTGILELSGSHREVEEAHADIMKIGVAPKILAKQEEGGYWEKAEDFYIRTKYGGTVWQLIILAELGSDGKDPRLKEACEFILQYSQDRESGGFSYRGTEKGGGFHSCVLPCLGDGFWRVHTTAGFKSISSGWACRANG